MLSLRTSDRCHWCGNLPVRRRIPDFLSKILKIRGIPAPVYALARNDTFFTASFTGAKAGSCVLRLVAFCDRMAFCQNHLNFTWAALIAGLGLAGSVLAAWALERWFFRKEDGNAE